jgi:hypothetical protein
MQVSAVFGLLALFFVAKILAFFYPIRCKNEIYNGPQVQLG